MSSPAYAPAPPDRATSESIYDAVPYENHAFKRTHPDALYVVGKIFGMEPAPIESARVLELGCGNGNNILPIAATFPGAEVVGIDLAPRTIEQGQAKIRRLGLSNASLYHLNIQDFNPSYGKFDYIICHGIYSWVDDSVRESILQIAQSHLTPQGIAFISYNAMPGWHFRGLARELMKFHGGRFEDPPMYVNQARAILEFMAQHGSRDQLYHRVLQREAETVRQLPDWHLFHDYLEVHNKALYISEFVSQAQRFGLQYLGDSEISKLVPQEFSPEVQKMLGRFSSDIVAFEQYMDFLRNRMFRRTLLCHSSVELKRELLPEKLLPFQAASSARKDPSRPGAYIHSSGGSAHGLSPILSAALDILSRIWPHSVSMERLFEASRTALPVPIENSQTELSNFLAGVMRLFLGELVELRSTNYPLAREIGERPAGFTMARSQAAGREGEPTPQAMAHRSVVSLLHEEVAVDPFQSQLLALIDGTRTISELTQELSARTLHQAVPLPSSAIEAKVDESLEYFLRSGLLKE